ncbi:small GTPase superfamily protein [Kipferlia bialata]|uniref:Small GTPase superfamily protein n=1 Tax=Kipferlia bialata TaxID=797122 RepID=A0A9K3CYZ5_9EUKA|nr:small GTPase superfamily protein [Kipferlia bialata]|eukprot:g6565.t1
MTEEIKIAFLGRKDAGKSSLMVQAATHSFDPCLPCYGSHPRRCKVADNRGLECDVLYIDTYGLEGVRGPEEPLDPLVTHSDCFLLCYDCRSEDSLEYAETLWERQLDPASRTLGKDGEASAVVALVACKGDRDEVEGVGDATAQETVAARASSFFRHLRRTAPSGVRVMPKIYHTSSKTSEGVTDLTSAAVTHVVERRREVLSEQNLRRRRPSRDGKAVLGKGSDDSCSVM